ncbi:DUF4435 domain-containing protein [Pseudomonas syringae]|uniref:DUF4435 domain-containing protein n=1 Tax=Pseudomonas syringae TaxID=317 RepID=UPI00040CE076|nr:AAA family ATPase [Pseudomonas syringae]KPY69077.1 ABC transporter ATP-binding protein-related protein [Pseudomonas syringae pv. syringae]
MDSFTVPLADSQSLNIPLAAGDALYLLGANGTGKSTLLYQWAHSKNNSVLISGSRDITLDSPAVSISANQALLEAGYAKGQLTQSGARYAKSFHNNESWLRTLFFKLKAKGDYQNDQYRIADQQGDVAEKNNLHETMPIELLNRAFEAAHLPLVFGWSELSELLVTRKTIDNPYGMNQMSDGERSACIIAVQVILAPEHTILFIDEPERHLHRAISAPLISYLRQIRPDISWVIATHDLSLARDDSSSSKLLVYSYRENCWNADLITGTAEITHTIAEAIYGAKQKVLFVEGDADSLDLSLYKLLYSNITVVPTGSCKEVEQAIAGLNNIQSIHHMDAFGIVDADNRVNLENLQEKGIYSLGLYAIESIYYHPIIIYGLLETAGTDLSFEEIIEAACLTIKPTDVTRLARDAAYKAFRAAYLNAIPSVNEFCDGRIFQEASTTQVDRPEQYEQNFRKMIDSRDWESVLTSFKIKTTSAPNEIARKLGYTNASNYVTAARKLIKNNLNIRTALCQILPDPFEIFINLQTS